MAAFATLDDLEARWKTLTSDEEARADVLLDDAAALMRGLASKSGIDLDDFDDVEILKMINCNVVRRAMGRNDSFVDVSSVSMTAGPYAQTFQPVNPTGDLYLSANEKRMLGIGSQKLGHIAPKVHLECGGVDSW